MIPNLLTISDFTVHPMRIPADNDFGNDDLTDTITSKQNNIIRRLLGNNLYKAFDNDMIVGVPQTQRFTDLLNGSTYTYNGYDMSYSGLKEVLKGFMYYYYIRYKMNYTTNAGIVTPSNQNSTTANIANLAVNAWNTSIDLAGCEPNNTNDVYADTLYNFLMYNISVYPEFDINIEPLKRINILNF